MLALSSSICRWPARCHTGRASQTAARAGSRSMSASSSGIAGQAARSIGGSLGAFATYLGVSACADLCLDPATANATGIAAGATLNFALQRRAFGATLAACRGGAQATFLRYCLAEAAIIGSQQGLFVCGLRWLGNGSALVPAAAAPAVQHAAEPDAQVASPSSLDEKSLMALRVASQGIVFVVLSFPIRKYWVFAA
eukprot:TRINITY_DN59084_c0_g1_i1.p2 TRINITY_DN59084_c0_g1~~TRINITY_DN59084_c0_g1_i1.p2  ORF type:complete len:197 (+),score=34.01 TRINITY_DN59084_c0_g1_i1:137-727(+)